MDNMNIEQLVIIANEAISLLKADIANNESVVKEDSIGYFSDALKSLKEARDCLKKSGDDDSEDNVDTLEHLIFELEKILGVRYGL